MFAKSASGYSWKVLAEKRVGVDNSSPQSLDLHQRLKLATEYIEGQCTTKFGIFTEVSTNVDLSDGKICSPNIFDTSVLMDVLHSSGVALAPETTESVRNLLLRHRNSDQLWNFFHGDYMVIPDDVDVTCNAVLALLACGVEKEEVAKMAQIVLEKVVIHDDGLVDVYFQKPSKTASNGADSNGKGVNGSAPQFGERWSVVQKWPEYRRVDLVVISNLLLSLCRAGITHLPRLEECYKLLDRAVNAILAKDYDNPVLSTHAKNYNNIDVVCYFISRLIPDSTHARDLFSEKLFKIMETRLRLPNDDADPLSLACRILAGFYSGMLEGKEENLALIIKATETLAERQDTDNFSFPKSGLYNASKIFHFGSTALTTAFVVAAINTVVTNCPQINGNFNKTETK